MQSCLVPKAIELETIQFIKEITFWGAYSLSRSSGVSLGVPRVLTRRWKLETAVLISNTPEATACVVSCRPPPPLMLLEEANCLPLPASKSWKLIFPLFSLLLEKPTTKDSILTVHGDRGRRERDGDLSNRRRNPLSLSPRQYQMEKNVNRGKREREREMRNVKCQIIFHPRFFIIF